MSTIGSRSPGSALAEHPAGGSAGWFVLPWLLVAVAGCGDMYDQPRYEPLEPSAFFDDGASSRPVVAGTVARGHLDIDEHLHQGLVDGKDAEAFPFPFDDEDRTLYERDRAAYLQEALRRGRERYTIYCAPCHGDDGRGDGMIVRRGFSPPPSFVEPRATKGPAGGPVPTHDDLRKAPPGHFFRVMTYGHGAMYSYAARVDVRDRWRIAAFIRALQLSQGANAEDVEKLEGTGGGGNRSDREASR